MIEDEPLVLIPYYKLTFGHFMDADRPELTLDNSCGPFQLCLDKANPNFGFTSFDNLPASMITLVQVISGDNDVVVLWASIGAAPHFHATTALFYLLLGFLVLHVLINVLVAVFANVFTSSRELMQDKIERRRLGKTGAPSAEGSEQGNSDGRSQTREGNGVEKEICEGSDRDEHERQQKLDELLAQAAFNKPVDWVLATLKRNVDPSLQHCCNWMFRNWIYDEGTINLTRMIVCCT